MADTFAALMAEARKSPIYAEESLLLGFTHALSEILLGRGVPREQWAAYCGLSKSTMTKLLSGSCPLTTRRMAELAAKLDCDILVSLHERKR